MRIGYFEVASYGYPGQTVRTIIEPRVRGTFARGFCPGHRSYTHGQYPDRFDDIREILLKVPEDKAPDTEATYAWTMAESVTSEFSRHARLIRIEITGRRSNGRVVSDEFELMEKPKSLDWLSFWAYDKTWTKKIIISDDDNIADELAWMIYDTFQETKRWPETLEQLRWHKEWIALEAALKGRKYSIGIDRKHQLVLIFESGSNVTYEYPMGGPDDPTPPRKVFQNR